jgi:hypothetical protein
MQLRRHDEPDRVRRYSTEAQLRRIDDETERNLQRYATQPPELIDQRIQELQAEWSIERYLQLNVAAVGLSTALLAVTRDRRWGIATCAGLGFFLFHALEGFDPPLPLLRRLGVRTRLEINREVYALKVMRGDFDALEGREETNESPEVTTALRAVGVD